MKIAREITINTLEGSGKEIGAHFYIRSGRTVGDEFLIPYTLLSRMIAEAETVMRERLGEEE